MAKNELRDYASKNNLNAPSYVSQETPSSWTAIVFFDGSHTLSVQEKTETSAIQSALLNAIDYLLTHKDITTFDYDVFRADPYWTSYVKVGDKTYGPRFCTKRKQAEVKVAEAAMSYLS